MARTRDNRRRRGRRSGQPRAAAATPRPSRRTDAGAEPAGSTASREAGAALDTASLPARPRREIASSRPTADDAPRVQSWFYRLTHPRVIIAILDELRRVVWPSRQETANLTVVVLVVAIAVGVFLGAIDFGLNRVVEEALLP